MVNHISSPHYLTFFEEDKKSLSHLHNLTLFIDIQIFWTQVYWVLIDNGTMLKIVSFYVVQQPGMSEFSIDPRSQLKFMMKLSGLPKASLSFLFEWI